MGPTGLRTRHQICRKSAGEQGKVVRTCCTATLIIMAEVSSGSSTPRTIELKVLIQFFNDNTAAGEKQVLKREKARIQVVDDEKLRNFGEAQKCISSYLGLQSQISKIPQFHSGIFDVQFAIREKGAGGNKTDDFSINTGHQWCFELAKLLSPGAGSGGVGERFLVGRWWW